jgi:hypothetical protein
MRMKKKWFYSATLVGLIAVLLIPLMGFSRAGDRHDENEKARQHVELRSGGLGVPMNQLPPDLAGLYHEPKDGIISGAIGCQPDIHVFSKSNVGQGPFGPEPEHIVFSAGIKEISTQAKANKFDASGSKIYVQITSDRHIVLEQAFHQHETLDPNTQKPFWVSAVYLGGPAAANLPTGEYSYKFIAKDKYGHVIDVWQPEKHKITITE